MPNGELGGNDQTITSAPPADAPAPLSAKPRMSDAEIACFVEQLRDARHYLEFGCGGSTCVAASVRISMITSVETDAEWIEKCRGFPELEGLDVTFHHVDVGPVKKWGYPAKDRHARKWPSYYLDVWSKLASSPDVVLVDGRWRVACAMQALLRTAPGAKIIIHDFWTRPHYFAVLNYCDVVAAVDTLAVLKAREVVDWKAAALTVAATAMDCR
jgi:hypothetical protein